MPRKLSIPRKNWDSSMLEERRLQKVREIKESKLLRQTEEDRKNRIARWVQFAVVLWGIRLGLFGFGTAFMGLPSLLASVSNLTGLNLLLFLPQHDLASWHWTRTKEKMDAYDCIREGTPFVTSEVPMESPETVRNVLQRYNFKSRAKTLSLEAKRKSECEGFHYQNKDSPWSIENGTCLEEIKLLNVDEIPFPYRDQKDGNDQTCGVDASNCRDDVSWYVVEPFRAPLSNPVLSSISEEFQKYIAHGLSRMRGVVVQSMLWVSSAKTECGAHYDMDHNFFLQIAGTKTFVIAEPTTSLIFRTRSYLHPYWRQARVDSLKSVGAILPSLDESKLVMDSVFRTRGKSTLGPWEVTLYPGDMLFLPAFYYHHVKSGSQGSTSMNVWVPSNAGACMDRLVKSASLPYEDAEDVEVKALKLAIMGVVAFNRLGLGPTNSLFVASQQLGKIMEDRHGLTTKEDVTDDKTEAHKDSRDIQSFCGGEVGMKFRRDTYFHLQTKMGMISPVGMARLIKESASQVSSLLLEELKDPAVCLHVLLDYIDEVFHAVLRQWSSQEVALLYSRSCFATTEE